MSMLGRLLRGGVGVGTIGLLAVVNCGDNIAKFNGIPDEEPNVKLQGPSGGSGSGGAGGAVTGGSANLCECAATFAGLPPPSSPQDACGTCYYATNQVQGESCQADAVACENDPGCIAAIQCVVACKGTPSCVETCVDPMNTNQAFLNYTVCGCKACASKCPPAQPIPMCTKGITG